MFNRVEAFGKPNNKLDEDGKYITYVNLFQEPSGGTASEFVLKKGDEMSGELNLRANQPGAGVDYNPPLSQKRHIRFSTERTDNSTVRDTYLYQPGYSTDLMCSGAFIAKGSVGSTGTFYAHNSSGSDLNVYDPRVSLGSTQGQLRWNNDKRAFWSSTGGGLVYDDSNIFGWSQAGTTAYKPIQITSAGEATADSHAIHKGYVDDKFDFSKYNELS